MQRFVYSSLCISLLIAPFSLRAESKPNSLLAAKLQPFVEKNELAGAVLLVADKEKVLTTETVGYSNIEAKTPIQKDSFFWIASMTKPITAAAFMILVDEGKVRMDDPVTQYIPEFNRQMVIAEQSDDRVVLKKPAQPILLRHLLSHTAGLAFSSAVEKPTLDTLRIDTVVRSYAAEPLLHEPASKYLYSNEGINVAGRIIEIVSGMKYEDFLQERLFKPLGMNDTTFFPNEEQVKRLAVTYKPNKDRNGLEETKTAYLHYPLTDEIREPMPGGGLFSSANDVAIFGQLILNGGELRGKRLLSEASVKELTKKQTPEAIDVPYGYGFQILPDGFGHGGALSTNLAIFPEKGLVLVYLVQHAGFPGEGKNALGVFQQQAKDSFGNEQSTKK